MAYGRNGQATESPRCLVQIFFAEFHCKAVKIMPGLNLEETVGIIHTPPPPTSK